MEVEWIFRVLKGNIGSYKIFVHVDGAGNRINGDHEAVDEKYPVRLWDEGDVVIDRQTLAVPASFRAGRYTLLIGFFRGESRLSVKSGPHDGSDRARVGHVLVR